MMTQLEFIMNFERSELISASYMRFSSALRRCLVCQAVKNKCTIRIQNEACGASHIPERDSSIWVLCGISSLYI